MPITHCVKYSCEIILRYKIWYCTQYDLTVSLSDFLHYVTYIIIVKKSHYENVEQQSEAVSVEYLLTTYFFITWLETVIENLVYRNH